MLTLSQPQLSKTFRASSLHVEARFLCTYLVAESSGEGNYTDVQGGDVFAGGLDQFFAQGFGNRFSFGMHLKFVVDVFQVKGDGMKRDAKGVSGSFFVMSFD